jgi:hypothetical protein
MRLVARAARHELIALFGVAITSAFALRWAFFGASSWLWSFARPVGPTEITPWTRWAMAGRDGAEPYALLAVVGLVWLLVTAGMALFRRLGERGQVGATVALLGLSAAFAVAVPPRAPMSAAAPSGASAWVVTAGALLAAELLRRRGQATPGVPVALAVLLLPLCLVVTSLPSLDDLSCILAPALRLAHGAHLRDIYLQYDLLPSLLALGWRAAGASSLTFSLVCGASFYAAFLAIYALGRRIFAHPMLAAPLLVSVVVVRLYGNMMDASSTPQVTPLRIDLWIPVLAVAFRAGLRRWPVGLALGAACFFSRSIGTLYVGAYALALAADMLGARRGTPPQARSPVAADVAALARETAPSWAFVALAFIAARLVFGTFGSGAVALYRAFGVGMLRIGATSFYWWLLALTGAVGWLAYTRRAARTLRRGEAAIFAVALATANSIYFFGRSHEHNLINLAASFLFVAMLGVDLALDLVPAGIEHEKRWPRRTTEATAWVVLAACAFQYSGRVIDKLAAQWAIVTRSEPLPRAWPADDLGGLPCDEVLRAAGDRRVYFLSRHDYWLYERCDLPPIGFVQPVLLSILEAPLVTELDGLLAAGYKIVVPRQGADWSGVVGELWPRLGNPTRVETPHFQIYRRSGVR